MWGIVLMTLILLLAYAAAAQTPAGAGRDLARRIAAVVPKETISLAVRNLSSLAPAQVEDARRAVEAELRAQGVRVVESGGLAVRITASDNLRERLLVAEVPRGEERQVVMAAWPREAEGAAPSSLWLEKKHVWEQAAPILDFAVVEDVLLVLEPERVAVYARRNGEWEAVTSLAVAAPGPWPRDLRGRLVAQPGTFQAYLPGVTCRGVLEPAPSIACTPGETLWPLYSGATLVARAAFRPGRNFFDGPVTPVSGGRVSLPPFYSAALVNGEWVTDARGPWADVAGVEAPCGSGKQVLAVRREENGDSVQAFEMTAREPAPVGAPVDFPGTVTALWPSGAAAVSMVGLDSRTGRYAAYMLAVACGN
jgi:hypothetical protein